MKKLLFVATLLLSSSFSFGQTTDSDSLKYPIIELPKNANGDLEYQGVVEAQGLKAADLYANATAFLSKIYDHPEAVITVADREAGKLIFKYLIVGPQDDIKCLVTLDFKDNKFRYTFNNFTTQINFIKSDRVNTFLPMRDKFTSRQTWFAKAYPTDKGVKDMIAEMKTDIPKKDNW